MQQLLINKTHGNTITNHKRLTNRDLRGGGNFITQAFPTNFHKFWTKKILTSSENIEDFKEVTPAQKATIEAADAKWVEPSEEFIAECKAEDVVYNYSTGYFEYNGLVDITTEQMRQIMPYLAVGRAGGSLANKFERAAIRTITVYATSLPTTIALDMTFYSSLMETIAFKVKGRGVMTLKSMTQPFRACANLHTIYGIMDVGNAPGLINFAALATKLKYINIQNLKTSITFQDCPLLSLESITYMVENAINTAPITVTLHPDAYARLTDEIITAATAKQINFVTETA